MKTPYIISALCLAALLGITSCDNLAEGDRTHLRQAGRREEEYTHRGLYRTDLPQLSGDFRCHTRSAADLWGQCRNSRRHL